MTYLRNEKKRRNIRDSVAGCFIHHEITRRTAIPREITKIVCDMFMQIIKEENCNGKSVALHGFGRFYHSEWASRNQVTITGYGTHSKEKIFIPAHCRPAFKACPTWANKVRKNVKPLKKK